MRKSWYILLLLLIGFEAICGDDQRLEIGIFRNYNVSSAKVEPSDDSYGIYNAEDSLLYQLKKGETASFRLSQSTKKIKIKVDEHELGYFDKIYFKTDQPSSFFKINAGNSKTRKYNGNLKAFSYSGGFDLVNIVDMHHYLIGVIESETGKYQSKEFYKVQAVISRTYALKNINKFMHEGFNLTDLVNCQVYHGKMYNNENISNAVLETADLVLVDDEMNFISAMFYSNSGGQTANSEDVWNKEVSYLRSISDPFSKGRHNYSWSKSFDKDRFIDKVAKLYNYPIKNEEALTELLNFNQTYRAKYFVDWKYHILLTDVRTDFKLKSTFFSISSTDDKIVLQGNGFGHGVGLAQEGAMNMCDAGYSFKDVLFFYYFQVHLINLNQRNFFLLE